MSILHKIKEKLSKLDNERLAIGVVSILGLALLLPLLIVTPGLLESEWFLNLLSVPAEYANFIANGSYIGRLLNLLTANSFKTKGDQLKTKVTTILSSEVIMGRPIGRREKWFTPVGMLLGMVLAIVFIALHAAVPFVNVFSYFAYILFVLGYVCGLGSLFNRLGSSLDGTRLPQEKKAILFGIILGLLVSLCLIVILATTGTLPFVAVADVSKVFFDLFVLHKVLFSLTFVLSITSSSASFFDYFSKAYCFLKYKGLGIKDNKLTERIESRKHEYQGAFLGLTTGCLLTLIIIMGLALTGGLAAAPIAVCATLFMVTVICTSVSAALFSRIGRVIDGIVRSSSVVNRMNQKAITKAETARKNPVSVNKTPLSLLESKLDSASSQIDSSRRNSVAFFVSDKKIPVFKAKLSTSMPNLSPLNKAVCINSQANSLPDLSGLNEVANKSTQVKYFPL